MKKSDLIEQMDLHYAAKMVYHYLVDHIKENNIDIQDPVFLKMRDACVKTKQKAPNRIWVGLRVLMEKKIISRAEEDRYYFLNPMYF